MELIREARHVCEQLPDQMPSRFSTDSAEHLVHRRYERSLVLSGARRMEQAEQQARTALGGN